MTIGYFVENIAAFLFTCAVLLYRGASKRFRRVLSETYDSFYGCAVFLTFSIQIAVIITLAEANFGLTTNGMESYTVQITWTVSVLTLFPLTYVALIKNLIREPNPPANRSPQVDPGPEERTEKGRESFRTYLYLICIGLSFYPFISSMFSMYGPSQIGDSPGKAINNTDWQTVQNICLGGPSFVTNKENNAMYACLTISWVIVYGFTIGKLLLDIANASNLIPTFHHLGPLKQLIPPLPKPLEKIPWESWPLVLVPILATTQFWTYLRLHQAQKDVAETSDNPFLDNQWSFGQIVAITVFTPVIVECLFQIRQPPPNDRPGAEAEEANVRS